MIARVNMCAGIGHETAKAMAKAGAHVILATRSPDKADT